MINIPKPDSLLPVVHPLSNGLNLFLFPSESTELLRMDIMFEAGSAYQQHFFCSAAANKLLTVATREMDATRMAEFLDYRGVVIETSNEVHQSTLSVYMLRRFAPEVLPVIHSMLTGPAYDEDDFELWKNKKKNDIAAQERRTSEMARRLFYKTLFGSEHPLGMYAGTEDVESLTLDMVKQHHGKYYHLNKCTLVLAGKIDDQLIAIIDRLFASTPHIDIDRPLLDVPAAISLSNQPSCDIHVPEATQTTLRMGRVLPLKWDDVEYANLMLLTTLLGGYFGSRLMNNIREDKGYTYGIYSHTQIFRGVVVFYITSDLTPDSVADAQNEINKELEGLSHIEEEELQRIKTIFAADFIRSIDGVFERSTRFCDMISTCVDERLSANISAALKHATASDLEKTAVRLLAPDSMIVCRAGQLE